jgi:cytosine/adenosine deaminase-related metal-dependent hydrolase
MRSKPEGNLAPWFYLRERNPFSDIGHIHLPLPDIRVASRVRSRVSAGRYFFSNSHAFIMIYRSHALVSMDGPPIADGAVVVQEERIAAVGPWPEIRQRFTSEAVTDLGERVILPGFINAHCHLDYSNFRHAIQPQASFADWIGRINALKRSMDPADYLTAIAHGFAESRRWGTTSIFNVESFPEIMWKLPTPPLRTWWFLEMIDVRSPHATEELVAGALLFFQDRCPDWLGGWGLSPHAPYTASRELYGLSRDCARRNAMPWTTHLGESRDEREMFLNARGPLHHFLASLGRPMDDCGRGRSALAQLTEAGAMGPECIAVHLNDWEEEDFDLLAPGGPLEGLNIVHCPLSHRYFQHDRFPLERLRALGANLCVGTDSPASDGSFSLLAELRALAETVPALSPRELLTMITRNPARAVGLDGRLGVIRPGAWADLIALPASAADLGNIYAEALDCHSPIHWAMVHGRVV